MSLFSRRIAGRVSIVAATFCLLLAGCSGDPRPLQEAVEVQEIGLAGLTIVNDQALDGQTFISPQQTIQFTFKATDSDGDEITVANDERRWSVDNYDIADISDSGLLKGKFVGTVSVGLRIGGIAAQPIQVTVSNAVLTSVVIAGADTLTECSPSDTYTATGIFGSGADESVRKLNNVEWRMFTGDSGRLLSADPIDGAVVGALMPGNVTLLAESGGVPASKIITVVEGIKALEISPASPIEVERNAPRPLTALATYMDEAVGEKNITSLATWEIDQNGTDIATVSDEVDSKGQLRGVRIGQTQVFANCSGAPADAQVVVVEPEIIVSLRIEPDDSPVELFANGSGLQLQVFAISAKGSDEEVSDLAAWRVESGEDVISVDNSSASGGFVEALSTGRATVEVSYRGVSQTVSIIVL